MIASSYVRLISMCAGAALVQHATVARAQTFKYVTDEEAKALADAKAVDWTATVEAGLVLTTGNSKTTTATAAAKAIRLDHENKLQLDVGAAYARSTILIANDISGNGMLEAGEIQESTSTGANSWNTRLRYDRFLTEHDAIYAAALAAADRPAGKELVAGGQVGYSRRLFHNDCTEVVAEVGYDLSYERPLDGAAVVIHSARAFAGYHHTIGDKTAIDSSAEVLSNLLEVDSVPEPSGSFEDTRITAMVSLTTKITDDISLSFSITGKYDNVPGARAALSIPYAAGFVPVAEKLDTITKASLIVALF